MATKRIVHTLVVQVRLPDGAEKSWRFRVTSGESTPPEELAKRKRKARAEAKARATSQGAEILSTSKGTPKTKWRALVPQPDGTYRERVFDSWTEAVAHEKAQQTAQVIGINLDLSKVPLGTVASRWRDQPGTMKWSAAYQAQIDSFLRAHVLPRWADVPVGGVIHSDVLGWCGSMHRGGLSMGTVRRVCDVLKRNLAVMDGAIARNPCSGIEWGSDDEDQAVGRWLERSEVQALALGMPEQYQALVFLGAGAGLRFSELAGLRRDRILAPVDLNRSWRIRVDEVLVEVQGRLITKGPKTKKSRREVPIPSRLAEVVLAHCDRFEVGPADPVFTSPRGARLRRGVFSKRVFYPVSEKVLGERVHTHDLRRTFVAQCAGDGIPAEVVQQWAGHGSLRVTMDIYHSVLPSTEAAAVALLEEANSAVDLTVSWSTYGPGEGDEEAEAV